MLQSGSWPRLSSSLTCADNDRSKRERESKRKRQEEEQELREGAVCGLAHDNLPPSVFLLAVSRLLVRKCKIVESSVIGGDGARYGKTVVLALARALLADPDFQPHRPPRLLGETVETMRTGSICAVGEVPNDHCSAPVYPQDVGLFGELALPLHCSSASQRPFMEISQQNPDAFPIQTSPSRNPSMKRSLAQRIAHRDISPTAVPRSLPTSSLFLLRMKGNPTCESMVHVKHHPPAHEPRKSHTVHPLNCSNQRTFFSISSVLRTPIRPDLSWRAMVTCQSGARGLTGIFPYNAV